MIHKQAEIERMILYFIKQVIPVHEKLSCRLNYKISILYQEDVNMYKAMSFFFIAVILSVSCVFAEGISMNYNGNTGDKSLDLDLKNLNISADADKDNFIKEMSISYNTSEGKIKGLIERDKMEPADIYMTFEISRLSKKNHDAVIDEYKNNKGKGWGYIAKQMGIKPGSPEFKELKNKTKEKNEKMKKPKGKRKDKEKGKKK
jgi:hypothetical protein